MSFSIYWNHQNKFFDNIHDILLLYYNNHGHSLKTINTIKKHSGEYMYQLLIKKQKRHVYVSNIKEAENIGIIFNATHTVNYEIIKGLVKELHSKDISVTALGFVDSDNLIDHYLIRKGFDFFTHKNLNWYYRPVGEKISEFINQEFDILINLSLEKFLPLDFIILESRAKFKVGKMFDDHSAVDMMIDTSKEIENINILNEEIRKERTENGEAHDENEELNKKSNNEIQLSFLIHQILYYLQMIKH